MHCAVRLAAPIVAASLIVGGVGNAAATGSEAGMVTATSVAARTEASELASTKQTLRQVVARKSRALERKSEMLKTIDKYALIGWGVRPGRAPIYDKQNMVLSANAAYKSTKLTYVRASLRYARSMKPANYDTYAYGVNQAARLKREIEPLLPLVPKDETYSPKNRLDGLLGSATAIHARSPKSQLDATRSKVAWVEEALERLRRVAAQNADETTS